QEPIVEVKYLNNQFVALAVPGRVSDYRLGILTSSDGRTWTKQVPADDNQVAWASEVAYGAGVYIIPIGSGHVLRSTDAHDWTLGEIGSRDGLGINHGNGTFVAAGDHTIARSTDGVNWVVDARPDVMLFESVAFEHGFFFLF